MAEMNSDSLNGVISSDEALKGVITSNNTVNGILNNSQIGITLKQAIGAISTSNGITNEKTDKTINISGLNLETSRITNLEIEKLFN